MALFDSPRFPRRPRSPTSHFSAARASPCPAEAALPLPAAGGGGGGTLCCGGPLPLLFCLARRPSRPGPGSWGGRYPRPRQRRDEPPAGPPSPPRPGWSQHSAEPRLGKGEQGEAEYNNKKIKINNKNTTMKF